MEMDASKRSRLLSGKASLVALLTLTLIFFVTLLVIYFAINLSPVGWRQERIDSLPLKSETLSNYLEDPSNCAADLDKTYEKISLIPVKDTVYNIALAGKGDRNISLSDVDLRIFIPTVPEIAKGDRFLTHLTLLQRELNRNDTIFHNTAHDDLIFNVANNCLRAGLFEIYLTRTRVENPGKIFHGWFEFPLPLYKRLFKEMNGFSLDAYEAAMQHYLRPDGEKVNLDYLREIKEEVEISLDTIDRHHENPINHFEEQLRKAKLILSSGLQKYGDIYEKKNQPVKLMQFDEPGIYKKKKVMKFDFSPLKKPERILFKRAFNQRLNKSFNELEITFSQGHKLVPVKNWPFLINRNGLKLVLGGWNLDDIPLAGTEPLQASDFARFTFGVGTPDIYATYKERLKNLNEEKNTYLFLLDKNDCYVDNHTFGIDQVYISRLKNGTFILYLVSYERIMLLAHWTLNPPEDKLVKVKPEKDKSTGSEEAESHENIPVKEKETIKTAG